MEIRTFIVSDYLDSDMPNALLVEALFIVDTG